VQVLVATDGKLDPDVIADFAGPLAGEEGGVDVLTVVEIPRKLLSDLRTMVWGQQTPIEVHSDAEYIDVDSPGGDTPRSWPGDDAIIARYLEDKRAEYTRPVVTALGGRNVSAVGHVVESENAAESILEQAGELDVDVIVIGSHGLGAFEGLLGSVGTKIVRRSKLPVLLIRVG